MFDPGSIWKTIEKAFIVLCVAFIVLVIGWALFQNYGCAAPGAVQAPITGVAKPISTTITGGGVDSVTAILLAGGTVVTSVGTTIGIYTKWVRPKRIQTECKAGLYDRRRKSNGA